MEKDRNLYKFGMDWLNGVLPVTDVWEVFEQLKLFSSKLRFERWELVNSGKYNYSRRYCLDGKASVQLMYNPVSEEEVFTACIAEPKQPKDDGDDMEQLPIPILKTHNNPYVFFSISGDGIRYLHNLGGDTSALNKLLYYFYRNGFRASRFDVYCDILDKNNDVVPLLTEAFQYFGNEQVGHLMLVTQVQHKRKNVSIFRGLNDDGSEFYNLTLGHHGTRFGMFRCYNKLVEVKDGRLSDLADSIISDYGASDYWYRMEYEMHKENAAACFDSLMKRAENENSQLYFEDLFYSALERVFSVALFSSLSCRFGGHYSFDEIWSNFLEFVRNGNIHLI